MNIQIFGRNKSFDTKKAVRYFKERHIPYQYIDLDRTGLSRGEYESVRAQTGFDALVDQTSKAYENLFVAYLTAPAAEEKLLEHPELYKAPIVRNGRKATVGYCPDVWAAWE